MAKRGSPSPLSTPKSSRNVISQSRVKSLSYCDRIFSSPAAQSFPGARFALNNKKSLDRTSNASFGKMCSGSKLGIMPKKVVMRDA